MKISIVNIALSIQLALTPFVQADLKGGDNKRALLKGKKGKKKAVVKGVNDLDYYNKVAKAFVGLNPITGDGSGFIIRNLKDDTFGEAPDSNTGRNDLCTCDCNGGPDGVGCVGYGGINFRYGSLLWTDPVTEAWTGQMQAFQVTGGDDELNFLGSDQRLSPGGPAIYNVACTQAGCADLFGGVFRQYNDEISCAKGIEDELDAGDLSCSTRCGENGIYTQWLEYCHAATDESETTGFTGYGR